MFFLSKHLQRIFILLTLVPPVDKSREILINPAYAFVLEKNVGKGKAFFNAVFLFLNKY